MSVNRVCFTYIESKGMIIAVRHNVLPKREDGALSRGPRRAEQYREKTKLRPLEYVYKTADSHN